jgi:hypothetical protein
MALIFSYQLIADNKTRYVFKVFMATLQSGLLRSFIAERFEK